MDVGPARQPRSPLVFQVGADPHFPRLERFPTENSMEFPQKIRNGSAFQPSDSVSGILFEETRNTNLKEYMHAQVHCSYFQ